jgi:tetratricopeptide (TPR) repeat protein
VPTLDDHARLGLAAIQDERFDDAVAAFRAAVDLAPERPDINSALGMAYLHRGDAGNAIPSLEAAVRLSGPYQAPEHQERRREFALSLATAYQLMDRISEAEATLAGVIARWPDASVEARLQLGQLLLSSCRPTEGCAVYEAASDWLDKEQRQAAEALVGSVRAFLDAGHPASVFLEAHGDSYRAYFDEIAKQQAEHGWYAEAARMTRDTAGAEGELVPLVPDGARPWALERVDLVNPADGTVSSVYSEREPMVVAVEGLEALAQVPILLPWPGHPFEVWVCTRCPWHWLPVVVEFSAQQPDGLPVEDRVAWVEPTFSSWYLAGWNGEFGDRDTGRFHYVTDPAPLGSRAVALVVDLGRAKFAAIPELLRRLAVLHDAHPLRRVLFGEGRLPEDR